MLVEYEIDQEVCVLMLILLADIRCGTVWHQLMYLRLPEHIHLDGEWLVQLLLEVSIFALQDVVNARCHFWLIIVEVLKRRLDI